MKRARLLLVLPPVLLVIAGCGSSPKSSSNSSTASSSAAGTQPSGGASVTGGAIEVTMKSLAFNPTTVNAKVGQTIEWTNQDGPAHNVTYVSGPKFTSSGTLNSGGKFSLKLTEAGTIHYFCSIHPFMKATIVVTK